MSWRQCKVNETADEVRVEVRFLHPGMALFMCSALTIFWVVIFLTEGLRWPLVAVMVVTSCFAFFIGFATSCLSLRNGQMITWSKPFAIDRATTNPLDIQSLSCSFTKTPTARGTIERYAVEAQVRGFGFKPKIILAGFNAEKDALEVINVLTRRLRLAGVSL